MPTENKNNCELCKIKVDVTDFTLETAAGLKSFCCAGCKCIYEIFHTNNEKNDTFFSQHSAKSLKKS
jgi:bifunctional pyridoxal-dependent enzyme with beta-cystathionase and maltose regulon repressor activities